MFQLTSVAPMLQNKYINDLVEKKKKSLLEHRNRARQSSRCWTPKEEKEGKKTPQTFPLLPPVSPSSSPSTTSTQQSSKPLAEEELGLRRRRTRHAEGGGGARGWSVMVSSRAAKAQAFFFLSWRGSE